MKKYVVLSVTENDDYLYYLPIVAWCWNQLGWNVFCFAVAESSPKVKFAVETFINLGKENFVSHYENDNDFRKETVSQCLRLYAASFFPDSAILMTSDSDMMPLSDYWKESEDIISYGKDLSDTHYPMCYVSAPARKWKKIMNLTGNVRNDMKRDLLSVEDTKSEDKEKWWVVDQVILTKKLTPFEVVRIDRGECKNTGYPIGRIDRSSWHKSLDEKERIDCHLLRPSLDNWNFYKTFHLIKECFPDKNIEWIKTYTEDYRQKM